MKDNNNSDNTSYTEEGKRDLFDKLMSLPILNIFEPFYKKHKEVLLYLFFGGLSFIVSIGTFALFNVKCGINELIANILSWIITVLFAFITNRIWVFESKTEGTKAFVTQMLSFYGGRIITLVIEELILFIFITWLGFPSIIIKVIAQIVVIVLNYIISKMIIFKK
ncbi:MAG: GtrA family protein [Lachnospiraceae bacterium]|nr:GtrA family protein [Lachnospiraceae bacterium]